MKKIKHPVPLKLSKEELVSFQLKFTLRKFNFNETELLVLAYIYLYGDGATDKILKDKVLGSYQTVKNYISKLRKSKVILEDRLHPNIKVFEESLEYTFELLLLHGEDEILSEVIESNP